MQQVIEGDARWVDIHSSMPNTWFMTAVIDIPGELYQKATARVPALGRRVAEVMVELYKRSLGDEKDTEVSAICELIRRLPIKLVAAYLRMRRVVGIQAFTQVENTHRDACRGGCGDGVSSRQQMNHVARF